MANTIGPMLRLAGIVTTVLAISALVLLVAPSSAVNPACSGRPITYAATDPPFLAVAPKHGIAAVPYRGGPVRWLLGYPAYQPSWSRDGGTFVFVRGEYRTVIWALVRGRNAA